MKQLKIGVLGSGDIATRVSKALQNVKEVAMYAVASRNYEHAKTFGETFGYQKIYRTYDEVIADEQVDLVYIGLHHVDHYEFARKCLEHRKPVLCEKPFTINRYQAEELIRAFREAGVFLGEALWTRFIPARKKIQEVLDSGAIGKPVMIEANMIFPIYTNPRMSDIARGGGALLDLGVYALNFASMFFGDEPEEMKSLMSYWETGVDGQEAVILKYPDGKLAVCKVSMIGSSDAHGIIYGTGGRIVVNDVMNLKHVAVYDTQNHLVEEFAMEEGIVGYEYEFLASKKALEEGKTEFEEMPLDETAFLMRQYDSLRSMWGFDYPCERGLG